MYLWGCLTRSGSSQTHIDGDYSNGFLAFLRLIGTVYFKKHASAFDSDTPEAHFKTYAHLPTEQQHKGWIEEIRQNTWEEVTTRLIQFPLQMHYGYTGKGHAGFWTCGDKQN